MASTYSDRVAALNDIATRVRADRGRFQSWQQAVATAGTDLASLATQHAAVLADIAADATANPANPALQEMRAESVLAMAEVAALVQVISLTTRVLTAAASVDLSRGVTPAIASQLSAAIAAAIAG